MKNHKRKKSKGDKKNRVKREKGIKILLEIIIYIILYIIFIEYINSSTIIELNINGIGEQKILSNEFKKPNEIYINEEIQNYTEYYNLTRLENKIIMKWNTTLEDLNNMLSNKNNITKIDFSNGILLSKNINEICIIPTLISLNLNNFKISGGSNFMSNMFSGCSSLISLNLNNFTIDSENSNFMSNMFSGCSSLVSLNLNNFTLHSGNSNFMSNMSSGCSSLISLNLNNFTILLQYVVETLILCQICFQVVLH